MTIRWYPGHMGKAQEKMAEAIRKIDVIIEVLDARLPLSSSNHQLEEMRRNKPCIKVLNKHDLADPAVTKAWVRHFERESGVCALPLSARASCRRKAADQTLPENGAASRPAGMAAAGDGVRNSQYRQIDPDQHPGGEMHGQGR